MKNLFTYGSLMFPAVWDQVVQQPYRSAPALIRGFRRLCVRDVTYPALVIGEAADTVLGRVYFDVSADDLARLDHFETDKYERVGIVTLIDDAPVAADAYLATKIMDRIEWRDWDAAAFERELLPRFEREYMRRHLPPA